MDNNITVIIDARTSLVPYLTIRKSILPNEFVYGAYSCLLLMVITE